MLRKTRANNTSELIKFAYEKGILGLDLLQLFYNFTDPPRKVKYLFPPK